MRLVVGFLCLQSPFPVVTAGRSTFATTARATACATAATCRADVRLHVVIETFLPLEDLSALQTGVRRGFAVDALVPQQVHASLKLVAAGVAGVGLPARVDLLHVLLELALVFEPAPAMIAREGRKTAMYAFVSRQVFRRFKRLIATRTFQEARLFLERVLRVRV